MHKFKSKPALPSDKVARIHVYRDILDNLIEECNEVALASHAQIMEHFAAKKAAREAAANQPQSAQDLAPSPNALINPEILPHLIRAIEASMRLDAWFADRLNNTRIFSELAVLNHPNRQAVLDYIDNTTRFGQPFAFQRATDQAPEISLPEELAADLDRDPVDMIAEICNDCGLPCDPNDFPSNWRPSKRRKPSRGSLPNEEDPETHQTIFNAIVAKLNIRHRRGLNT